MGFDCKIQVGLPAVSLATVIESWAMSIFCLYQTQSIVLDKAVYMACWEHTVGLLDV